jgi:hypothetical protein
MKRLLLLLVVSMELFARVVYSPIATIDREKNQVTINIDTIDVGMSGFAVHKIDETHNSILKSVVVKSFDRVSGVATLKLSEFKSLKNNALPQGDWKLEVGDSVVLAFAYDRALLIAPSEEIYYRISKSVKIQWVHPDIFATILSFKGHPTPLKSDFESMSSESSIGVVFIYLDKRVFTVDAKSFKILSISDAPLTQESVTLPFYTRVPEIDAAWWGEGSSRLKEYAPHYYELLVENNRKNRELYKIVKNSNKKVSSLINEFEIKE